MWDVNRKIPFDKLYRDIKAGKYKGATVGGINKKYGYFMMTYQKHGIEVDKDQLNRVGSTPYKTGIADRFDINLPGFNRGGADAVFKFNEIMEKEYGSKFVSDFEMERPETEWVKHTDTGTGIQKKQLPKPSQSSAMKPMKMVSVFDGVFKKR